MNGPMSATATVDPVSPGATRAVARATQLPADVERALRCPRCRSALSIDATGLACLAASCGLRFPIVDRVPVLIDDTRSLFSIDDFVQHRSTTFSLRQSTVQRLLAAALDRMPSISGSPFTRRNYARLRELLVQRGVASPTVLVIGGSILGDGMQEFAASASIRIVSSDVSFGPLTTIICDGHDLPFADGTFDAVILQAVLEHVVDPVRCVSEAHRVLAPGGLVYAETPFMQQVHMGPYDFTRFSHSAHRRLFRQFDEVDSGVAGGPGVALAWSYQYFLLSFATSRAARGLLRAFASLTAFFLKYFDSYLVSRKGALDAAAGVYFLGRRSDRVLPDRELVAYYRGAIGTAR